MAKVTKSSVEVYKAKGETMDIAFKQLVQEQGFDNYNLEVIENLEKKNIEHGAIYTKAKILYRKYFNNQISEFTIFGSLYNTKPIIKDESRVVLHNIITKGTKKWETVNSYRTDSDEIIEEDTATKAEALERAIELAVEHNRTVNVIVSKRLVDMDGTLGIAEFMPLDCIDDTNVYIFWKYTTKVEEVDDDELADANTEIDPDTKQYSILEDTVSYYARDIITK